MHAVPVDVECARLRHRQQGGGKDALAGYNVHTVALQIPKSKVRGKGEVVGAWAAVEREKTSVRAGSGERGSRWVQVSRLGNRS
jgi:Domain of unknown function (DUF4331)